MVDLNKLAQEIHEAAVKKGFWDVEDAENKHIAKMYSELSEALQEDRMDRPMLYVDDIEIGDISTNPADFDGRKPEGIAAELADFVMMVLDFAAAIGLDVQSIIDLADKEFRGFALNDYKEMPLYKLVLECHSALTEATLLKKITDLFTGMCIMICGVNMWLEQRGIDLWQVIRLKMEYNKARPPLHGRKY